LSELREILTRLESLQEKTSSIKTDNYFLYSLADPHNDTKQFLQDYIQKNRLSCDSTNQVLEMKIPLSFEEYSKERNRLLSVLGQHYGFKITEPRKRDQLVALLRGRVLKEVAYGNDMAIAFYKSVFGNSYLEFVYKENIKTGVNKIYDSLESLLLAKPKIEGVR
jgi:hypothetical protein